MAVQGFGGTADQSLTRAIQRKRKGGPAGGRPVSPAASGGLIPPGQEWLRQGLIGSPRAQSLAQRGSLLDQIAHKRRRKGGSTGGKPYLSAASGAPTGGRPVL